MLFRPVYLKGSKMQEAPIPMAPPREPAPQPPPSPPAPPTPIVHHHPPVVHHHPPPTNPPRREDIPLSDRHLPLLISNLGFTTVYPHEATRDVITGKVAYILIDEKGISKFTPKHALTVMRLGPVSLTKYKDYPLIGGYERTNDPKQMTARYKRNYIDMDIIRRGIYGARVYDHINVYTKCSSRYKRTCYPKYNDMDLIMTQRAFGTTLSKHI